MQIISKSDKILSLEFQHQKEEILLITKSSTIIDAISWEMEIVKELL